MKHTIELVDEIWEAVQEQYSDIRSWDSLDSVVDQGLSSWDDESLIDEAQGLGIDTSDYK